LLRRHRNGVNVLLRGGHICLSALPFSRALPAPVWRGGMSHEFRRELAPFGAAKVARLFNGTKQCSLLWAEFAARNV